MRLWPSLEQRAQRDRAYGLEMWREIQPRIEQLSEPGTTPLADVFATQGFTYESLANYVVALERRVARLEESS